MGRMRHHDWTNDQGEKRSMLVVEVDDIGASVRFTTVQINGKQSASGQATAPWAAGATPGSSAAEGTEPPF
jgi:single-strand DNA-binding protein